MQWFSVRQFHHTNQQIVSDTAVVFCQVVSLHLISWPIASEWYHICTFQEVSSHLIPLSKGVSDAVVIFYLAVSSHLILSQQLVSDTTVIFCQLISSCLPMTKFVGDIVLIFCHTISHHVAITNREWVTLQWFSSSLIMLKNRLWVVLLGNQEVSPHLMPTNRM